MFQLIVMSSFGHHFAAIAGAGPLVGPVLAAQMGYLPGTLWLLAGVVLAGAVQDFMVLFISTRRNGNSLGEMIKERDGACTRNYRAVRLFPYHDHHSCGASPDCSESISRKSLGSIHRLFNSTYCPIYGDLYALYSPRSCG